MILQQSVYGKSEAKISRHFIDVFWQALRCEIQLDSGKKLVTSAVITHI